MDKFVHNHYGVRIKVCCASCGQKAYDRGCKRICMRGNGQIDKGDFCRSWTMSDFANYIRMDKEKGKIKRKEYFKFLVEEAVKEAEKEKGQETKEPKPTEEGETNRMSALRLAFQKKYGSIYYS